MKNISSYLFNNDSVCLKTAYVQYVLKERPAYNTRIRKNKLQINALHVCVMFYKLAAARPYLCQRPMIYGYRQKSEREKCIKFVILCSELRNQSRWVGILDVFMFVIYLDCTPKRVSRATRTGWR